MTQYGHPELNNTIYASFAYVEQVAHIAEQKSISVGQAILEFYKVVCPQITSRDNRIKISVELKYERQQEI